MAQLNEEANPDPESGVDSITANARPSSPEMASPLVLRYLAFSALFTLSFSTARLSETLDAAKPPLSSFSFQRFEKNHSFDSEVALYGDAGISDSVVRITRPVVSSRGRVMYRKPIRFLGTKPGFSSYFSFSVFPGNGHGLYVAFSLVSTSAPQESMYELPPCILSVQYVVLRGAQHIVINLGDEISVTSSDLSSVNLVINSARKLHSWIDYDGESKRVEVRLSKYSDPRPANPSIFYPIDLSAVIRESVFVGISSSSGNSTQITSVYSWNFTLKHGAPYLMHSEPLDPQSLLVKPREGPSVHLRTCPWRILMALVFGVACGLLVAFALLFMLSAMFDRRPVAPVEYPEHTRECRDEKIILVGDKNADSSSK